MKQFEQNLKKLIALSNGGCDPVYAPDHNFSEADLRFLAGKGLIRMLPAGDNEFYAFVDPAGLVYFSEKRDKARARWLDRLWGFLSGVAVTVIGEVILQTLVG